MKGRKIFCASQNFSEKSLLLGGSENNLKRKDMNFNSPRIDYSVKNNYEEYTYNKALKCNE